MYTKILVGTDGSKTATKAVDRAAELAASSRAHLTVFSAGSNGEEVAAAEAERLGGGDLEVTAKSASGGAASAIVDEAESGGYDLVVVGNKGLSGVRRMLPIGKVPNRVSHHLKRSLLVVKTT